MLTQEQNDLLTQTGPGTPGGDLLRRYWQPVALAEELPVDGAPLPVQILGERLVLFRNDQGRPGLLGLHCPHRAADLSYGRVENGGLRCLYHGWLFDVQGRCLEQPCEPADSDFYTKVKHLAYPCAEAGDLIFAYMGPGEPPLLPSYEFLTVPKANRYVSKLHHECNYLQGNEGNIDPAHLSFLHRFFDEKAAQTLRNTRTVAGSQASPNMLFGKDVAPRIEIEETEFGIRIFTIREAGDGKSYVRISNFVMPNLAAFPGQTQGAGYSINWHVPIDDTHHWKYTVTFSREGALDKEPLRAMNAAETTDGYHLKRTKENRYLQDREEMKTRSFIGMGSFFAAHDKFATESEGPIQDRTKERLGSTDRPITAQRQMLLRAIRDVQAGLDPIHVVRLPESNAFDEVLVVRSEVLPTGGDWRTHWKEALNREKAARVPVAPVPEPLPAS